jgi:hypothetical protein
MSDEGRAKTDDPVVALAEGVKAAVVLRLIAGSTDQTYTPTEVSTMVATVVDEQHERIRAALAARSEPALDVERLARALWKTRPMFYPAAWPNDDPHDIGPSPEEDAANIAREYAALAPERQDG